MQLINGNSVELFRNKNTLQEYYQSDVPNKMEFIKEFKDWIKLFQEDLVIIGMKFKQGFNFQKLLENENINELWNLFTAFVYFKKYLLDGNVIKNNEFVWDFFSKENILDPLGVNIIILEVDNDLKDTKYSLMCPKYYAGKDFYNKNKPSILVLKYDKSYELVCKIKFQHSFQEMEPVEVLLPIRI